MMARNHIANCFDILDWLWYRAKIMEEMQSAIAIWPPEVNLPSDYKC